MTGVVLWLLMSFLSVWCVRSGSLCVSSIYNVSLKISRARASVFLISFSNPMDQKAISSRLLLLPICRFSNTVKFFIQTRNFISYSSITFFYFCLSFSNSSKLSDINFTDWLKSANSFSPLIWLLLLESANLWAYFTSFSKFLKQLSKGFKQSSNLRLPSKISPGVLGVSISDTLGISDGLSSPLQHLLQYLNYC